MPETATSPAEKAEWKTIGVRVHFNDSRPAVLHSAARSFREDSETGILSVYAPAAERIAVHASMEWAWAELVCAPPEPARPDVARFTPPITFTTVPHPNTLTFATTGFAGSPEKTPVERAEQAVRDAETAMSAGVATLAQGVADAQQRLADLKRRNEA